MLALLGLALIYGFFPVYVRAIAPYVTPLQQLYIVTFGVSVVLLAQRIITGTIHELFTIPRRDVLIAIVRGILYYLLGAYLYVLAIRMSHIASVVLIQTLPMTAILGVLLFKEKLTKIKIVSILIAFIGAIIMNYSFTTGTLAFGLGEILSTVSIFFVAFALISTKWQSKKTPTSAVSLLMMIGAAVALFVTSIMSGERLNVASLPTLATAWFGIGISLNVIMILLANYGYTIVQGTIGTVIVSLESVFAIAFALVFFGETLTLFQGIGGACILFAAVLITRESNGK